MTYVKQSSQKKVQPARYRIEFNKETCIWCRSCELICSLHHEGECNPASSRIRVFLNLFEAEVEGYVCKQCEDPQCLYVCPAGAIQVDSTTGARAIRDDQCIACSLCAEACPYNSKKAIIAYNPTRNVFLKCDLCNGKPQCIEVCPSGALKYVGL